MTEIPFPTHHVKLFALGLEVDLRAYPTMFGGSEDVVDMNRDIWHADVTFEWSTPQQSGALEAFVHRVARGMFFVQLGHLGQPAVRGTLAASSGVTTAAVTGASSIEIQATNGLTLLAGDMLKVGNYLVMVQSDATANVSNRMLVPLVNRLRGPVALSAPVVLNAPKVPFVLKSSVPMKYDKNFGDSFTLSFEEM